ncbi:MAG: cyclic nucleotide-binding domain-containing protein [Aeromicrobium sp.]|uniref:cyclic nucleotide-binding domain-containing protein n=1 Tax=Aeromicrobium sp. TaxID=1871063 RepID=UPI003C6A8113
MARKPDPEIVAALTQVTDFSRDVISAMALAGTKVNIPERWSVMSESTPADMAYVLLSGEVEVRVHREPVATLPPGQIFGEIALLSHSLRSASVVATSPITVLRLDASSLQKIVDDHPDFAAKLAEGATLRQSES